MSTGVSTELSRKKHTLRQTLRNNFQKILGISKNNPDWGKAKCLALKYGLVEHYEQFFVIDDEIVDILEDVIIEAYILKSCRYQSHCMKS